MPLKIRKYEMYTSLGSAYSTGTGFLEGVVEILSVNFFSKANRII